MMRSSLFLLSITITFFSILSMSAADNNLRGMANNSTLTREENPLLKDENGLLDSSTVVRLENDNQARCPQKCKNHTCKNPKKKRGKCVKKIYNNGNVRWKCRCVRRNPKPKPDVCSPPCGTGYECRCILPSNPDLCQCRPLHNYMFQFIRRQSSMQMCNQSEEAEQQ
mmetsp:Transcript_443/g.720  ORF Transcript_443/g.720 Transcript_443/m.720 type:complete len:168 (-) Transcript_443:104-607(-)